MANLNTSRGCTSSVSIVPSMTSSTRMSRRRVFRHSTCNVSTFFTRFFARSRAARFRDCRHGRFVLQFLRHLVRERERRHQRHRLVAPDAPDLLQIRDRRLRERLERPNLFSNCCPTCTAFAPFNPVRSRIAINSAWLKASAPSAASRSRGRWLTGWSLRRRESDMFGF